MTRKRIRFDEVLKTKLGGVSRTTGERYVKNGTLPQPHKIGRFKFFYEDELDEALEAATSKAA